MNEFLELTQSSTELMVSPPHPLLLSLFNLFNTFQLFYSVRGRTEKYLGRREKSALTGMPNFNLNRYKIFQVFTKRVKNEH